MDVIFFRLTRNWVFGFISIASFMLIFGYSAYYYKQSTTYDDKWFHPVLKYESTKQLQEQIDDLQKSIQILTSEGKNVTEIENEELMQEISIEKETKEILVFLKERNIAYSDVVEGDVLHYFERSERGYAIHIWEIILIFLMLSSILLIGQIVCAGRTNGAFVISYLHNGRKRNFINEGLLGYLIIMTIFFVMGIVVAILRREFPGDTQYTLYYNNGAIKLMSVDMEFGLIFFSMFIILSCYYIVYFILAQLLNNNIAFYLIAIVITAIWLWVVPALFDTKFICALRITLPDIYANQISLNYYLMTIVVRVFVLMLSLYMTYRWFMKKNLRTKYD